MVSRFRKNIFFVLFSLLSLSCREMVPDWRNVTVHPFGSISESGIDNPVLTAADVDPAHLDGRPADFVADPFLFHEGGRWFMFFEIGQKPSGGGMHWGRIGLARSGDGIRWKYDTVAIDSVTGRSSPVHHSYPQVFKWDERYYMVTESYLKNEIRFYEAESFPLGWRLVYALWSAAGDTGDHPVGSAVELKNDGVFGDTDPSIFRYRGRWYMFANVGYTGCLYYSDDPLGHWREHPKSPFRWDKTKARAGGRVIVFDTTRILRVAQNCDIRYGRQVRVFEVVTLTDSSYEEREIAYHAPWIDSGAVFGNRGTGEECTDSVTPCSERRDEWNLCGMHQADAWWNGERWLIVTDGYRCLQSDDDWAIGMFYGSPAPRDREPFMERDIDRRIIRPETGSGK